MFGALGDRRYGAILADPPWHFVPYLEYAVGANVPPGNRAAECHYPTMTIRDLALCPVGELAARDCVLFCWVTWPLLRQCFHVIDAWGFEYKTCAFAWLKADNTQPDFFVEEITADMGLGFWTRANSEVCLLATRGKPKRLNADVRQAIVAPRREHSRKPDGIHERIERLVMGPYLELFARQQRLGWDVWGNEVDKFMKVS